MTITLLEGDCRATMATLPDSSVQCVITSPPYYGLRAYIADGDARKALEIGSEPTPELYIEHLCEVFREVWRVLRPDGTVWLNLGDSYAGSGKGPSNSLQPEASQLSKQSTNRGSLITPLRPRAERSHNSRLAASKTTVDVSLGGRCADGYKPKDLMLVPWRVAMALQAEGWWIRSVIPWLKRNGMPESVTDRPATATEYVFLLAKSARYYWDNAAVRMASADAATFSRSRRNSDWFFESWQGLLPDEQDEPLALVVNPQPFKESHFATFPPKLVEPMVKASSRPGDTLLDPFGGSGTVGLVADRLNRDAVLCELKPDYADMAQQRVIGDAPLFVGLERA